MDILHLNGNTNHTENHYLKYVVVVLTSFILASFAGNAQAAGDTAYPRIPYQETKGFSNFSGGQTVIFPRLPAGKTLVIENVSIYIYSGSKTQRLTELKLNTTVGGGHVVHYIETPEHLVNTTDTTMGYAMSRSLRLYTQEPLKVTFGLKNTVPVNGGVMISGYTLPSRSPGLGP